MSQFYARYIPPSSAKPQAVSTPETGNRKRSSPVRAAPKSKKRKVKHAEDGEQVIAKYRITEPAKGKDEISNEPRRSSPQIANNNDTRSKVFGAAGNALDLEEESAVVNGEAEGFAAAKHSKVLSKFNKSRDRGGKPAVKKTAEDENTHDEHIHPERAELVHGLEPIPQPDLQAPEAPAPSYSTVPEWLKTPLKVDDTVRRTFDDLGLDRKILENLASQNKRTTLPVQAAVLSLLVGKDVEHRPDLCVAAATGSGKTFAYVLPILHGLRQRRRTLLRAVIVVPTRTLVKQVVQTFDSCSKGMDIKIGTAEGSKTLAEEQRQLTEETLIYNPVEYKRRREAHIDWENFDLFEVIGQVQQSESHAIIDYVPTYLSKVDVLVCTPGRLVEHLQNTKGFNLDHVQWFVADEADRLLNESYHDWLEAVLPALKSQAAFTKRNAILEHMHIDVPDRRVSKILLSATMTSDISQLLGLELTNPKLVVVQNQYGQSIIDGIATPANESAEFNIPPGLVESAVALRDSENKPLYLLELIEKHIFMETAKPSERVATPNGKNTTSYSNVNHNDDETSSSGSSEAASGLSSASSSDDDRDDDTRSTSSLSSSSSSRSSSSSFVASETRSAAPQKRQDQLRGPLQQLPSSVEPHSRVLIFTKSTESAHRLSRLLSLLSPSLSSVMGTFTRSATQNFNQSKSLVRSRTKILQSFTRGTIRILISTDLAARGLDIPSLEHVINYDVPTSALTYVHRVGRTARAGLTGHAWTLVEYRQGKWFWETIGGKGQKKGERKAIERGDRSIQKVYLTIDKEKWAGKYEAALSKLGEDVRGQA